MAPKLPAELKDLLILCLLVEKLAPGGMRAFIDDCQRSDVPLFGQSGAQGAMYLVTNTDWGLRLEEKGRIRPEDLDVIEIAATGAARPQEMASVVAFLASEDASYMTGSIVAADGGVTAHTGQPNFIARRAQRSG